MEPLNRMRLALLLGAAASVPIQPLHAEPPAEEFLGVTCGYAGADPTAAGLQQGVYGGGPWLLGEVLPGTVSLPSALSMTCSIQVNDSEAGGAGAVWSTTQSIGPVVGVPPRVAAFDASPNDAVYVCTEISWKVGTSDRTLRYDADPGSDGDQCAQAVSGPGGTFVTPLSACASSDFVAFAELTPKDSDATLSAPFERSVQHLRTLRTAGTTTNVCGAGASDED